MRVPLKKFVEHTAERASRIFDKTGQFLPMYHFIDGGGQDRVMPAPATGKDESAAIMRALLKECGATRVAFLDEAWMLDLEKKKDFDFEKANREGISKNPDRIEVLLISGEDHNEGLLMATREIIRHGNKVVLGKLKIMPMDQAEGRMVGLLPAPAHKH